MVQKEELPVGQKLMKNRCNSIRLQHNLCRRLVGRFDMILEVLHDQGEDVLGEKAVFVGFADEAVAGSVDCVPDDYLG